MTSGRFSALQSTRTDGADQELEQIHSRNTYSFQPCSLLLLLPDGTTAFVRNCSISNFSPFRPSSGQGFFRILVSVHIWSINELSKGKEACRTLAQTSERRLRDFFDFFRIFRHFLRPGRNVRTKMHLAGPLLGRADKFRPQSRNFCPDKFGQISKFDGQASIPITGGPPVTDHGWLVRFNLDTQSSTPNHHPLDMIHFYAIDS